MKYIFSHTGNAVLYFDTLEELVGELNYYKFVTR